MSEQNFSVDDEDQLQPEDTLEDRGVDDVLDEGYSPPDREPAHLRHAPTGAEQGEGETLEERLAQEEPEPDPYQEAALDDDSLPDPRAGRLDENGEDVGIDGGAASAEEAAVHVSAQEPFRSPD